MEINKYISSFIPDNEEYIYGFANLKAVLHPKYKDYYYGVVIGKKLDDNIMDSVISGPNFDYLELYKNTNVLLSELIHKIGNGLNNRGIPSCIVEPTLTEEELKGNFEHTLKTDFSHKMAATRAGLGWIGKTALFISEKFGPRLRLATILTNYHLDCSNSPVNESKCGVCKLCVIKCPAQAAKDVLWNINLYRDSFFDPFKCWAKCLELSFQKMKTHASICGICVSVCPVGREKK